MAVENDLTLRDGTQATNTYRKRALFGLVLLLTHRASLACSAVTTVPDFSLLHLHGETRIVFLAIAQQIYACKD